MKNNSLLLQGRLVAMNFLEFAVWGAYLTSMGSFLATHGLATEIGWFYAVQGLVSLFMPGLIGVVADRWIPGHRLLGLCRPQCRRDGQHDADFHHLHPERRLLHAHDCPQQLGGFQCAESVWHGHRQGLPSHPRLRHGGFHRHHARREFPWFSDHCPPVLSERCALPGSCVLCTDTSCLPRQQR